MAPKVFRWRAVGPLLGFAVIGLVLWVLFAEELARRTSEDVGSQVMGARVDIGRLDIDVGAGNVTLRGLTMASPFDSLKNLFQADELVVDIEPLPLLEKKLVIDRVAVTGLRFGTTRTTSGFVGARRGSRTESVREEVAAFGRRFDIPALQLATGRLDVGTLDPERLATTEQARALVARGDSLEQAFERGLQGLAVGRAVDSARAALERLRGARATDLRAVNDARRTLEEVRRTRDRVAALERDATAGLAALHAGVTGLDEARRRDYARARELVRLPSLDPSDIAAALFAPVAIERFQQALYWVETGRRYLPPGLRPRAEPGPRRARRAGTTVRFPREQAYPAFLLRQAALSLVLGAESGTPRQFSGTLRGLTTAPSLYGRPTEFAATGPSVRVGALVDHVRGTPRDTAGATIDGVALPGFALPGLPFRLEPGRGTLGLGVTFHGDTVRARWSVRSAAVAWRADTARAQGTELERLVGRVLASVRDLDLAVELSGTLGAPRLSVRSNLDRALADGLRAALGEEVAAAERRLRSEVDRLTEPHVAPLRARAAALERDVTGALAEPRDLLDAAQRDLEQRLRQLTGGIRLPSR